MAVLRNQRFEAGAEPRMNVGAQAQMLFRNRGQGTPGFLLHPGFDAGDDAFGFLGPAVRHQPARAFRNPVAQEEHDAAQHATEDEGEPPTPLGRQNARIQHEQGSGRADRGADPETAVDHEVGEAALAGGNQLLDGGVDGGVLAADPGTREKAEQRKGPEAERSAGREGRGHVDQHGEAKQAFAPEHVCQIAEQQRAGDGASEIGGGSLSDLRGCQAEDRTLRDGRGQRPNAA